MLKYSRNQHNIVIILQLTINKGGEKYHLPTDTHSSCLPTLTIFSLAEPIHFQAVNQDESRSVVDNPIICLVKILIFAAPLSARNSYVI